MEPTTPTFVSQLPSIITSMATFVVALTGLIVGIRGSKKAEILAKATHALVNSDHGVSLRLSATSLQRIADLTRHSDDIEAARQAKEAADQHDATQGRINKETLSQ